MINKPNFSNWHIINTLLISSSTIIITLLCFSNSFYYYTLNHWYACYYLFLSVWSLFHVNFTPYQLCILTWYINTVWFWMINSVLIWADYNNPEQWVKYKIQEGTNIPLDMNKFWHVIRIVLVNQFYALIFYLIAYYFTSEFVHAEKLPTFNRLIYELLFIILIEEIFFYYGHRLLHTRFFYKRFHKVHHEWTSSIGVVSIYCHPVEHIMTNIFPVILGPLLMQSHIMVIWLWSSLATFNAVLTHSGYHLPWMSSPEAHDYHHKTFTEIYGVFGILDYLHGTDKRFRNSKHYDLHKIYYTDSYAQERIRKN